MVGLSNAAEPDWLRAPDMTWRCFADIEELSEQQESAASRQKQLTEELSRHGKLGEVIIRALHSG